MAVVGLTVPLVAAWSSFLFIEGIPARDRFVAWAIPFAALVAVTTAAFAGRYAVGVAVLAGVYVAQQWRDELTVGSEPIVPRFPDEFHIVLLDLFVTLLMVASLLARRRLTRL